MSLDVLTILGGQPAFVEPLHVGRPNIAGQELFLDRVRDIFERRWLSNNGAYVQQLESLLCERLGVRHCIPVCNGTVALQLAINACKLAGEVIVPSFTFVATANAALWQGIKPVFCDVDPATHLATVETIEKCITPQTSAILAVHTWGQPCDPIALQELAERFGLYLIFDAAHAFGCSFGDRVIGGFGNAEVFSFHATKFFNTFEGGAVATDDDDLARSIRLMKNFGFVGYDDAEVIGINGKMTEICAAMGVTGLAHIDAFITRNRENYSRYAEGLDKLNGVRLLLYDVSNRSNYQYVVLDIDPAQCSLCRDDLLEVLWRENVLARRYFYPGCHRMPAYSPLYDGPELPGTDRVSQGVLVLPTGTGVSDTDIDTICAIIRRALQDAESVQNVLISSARLIRPVG